MYKCEICKEHKEEKTKVELTCSHYLCKECLIEWEKRSNTCPFCRAIFVVEDPDPEEWLYLDPSEWTVYSKTDMRKGEEKIFVFRKDESPVGWRNNDLTIRIRKSKRVRKKIRNMRNREIEGI